MYIEASIIAVFWDWITANFHAKLWFYWDFIQNSQQCFEVDKVYKMLNYFSRSNFVFYTYYAKDVLSRFLWKCSRSKIKITFWTTQKFPVSSSSVALLRSIRTSLLIEFNSLKSIISLVFILTDCVTDNCSMILCCMILRRCYLVENRSLTVNHVAKMLWYIQHSCTLFTWSKNSIQYLF